MFKNISKKRIPFVILLACVSLLSVLSFIFLFLAGTDKGGSNFAEINGFIGYILQTINKNIIFFIILLVAALVMLGIGVTFVVINIKRNRKPLCFVGILGLVSAYEVTVWFAYFFCKLFGMSFSVVPMSLIGFVITCLNAACLVALLVVDIITGNKRIAYIIRDPNEDEKIN